MEVKDQLVFAFNTYFADFLIAAKKTSDLIKQRLKRKYRVVDRKSDEHLITFWEMCKGSGLWDCAFKGGASHDTLSKFCVVPGMPVSDLAEAGMPGPQILMHCRVLACVAYVFNEVNDLITAASSEGELVKESEAEGISELRKVIDVLFTSLEAAYVGRVDEVFKNLDSIVDTELQEIVRATLDSICRCNDGKNGEGINTDSIIDMMKTSVLGEIAQEIAGELELGELGGQDIEGLMSSMMEGGVMAQVTQKLQDKIASGKYKDADLMHEASKLLSSLGLLGPLANAMIKDNKDVFPDVVEKPPQ